MENRNEVLLVQSSFLKRKKENQNYKLTHIISGRQFSVDEATIGVLDYFSEPQTVKENELPDKLKSSIQYMMKAGMLVKPEEQVKETYNTALNNTPIFGFQNYDESNQEEEVVFIGVPFGGGNHYSNATGRFPNVLRKYIDNHRLHLTPESNPNYHFLGNNAEVHQLEYLIQQEKAKDAGDIFIHHFESNQEVYKKINFLLNKIVNNNKVPFSIGGDHSISYPIIASLTDRYPKFNVLHFDAHTDLYGSHYQSILDHNGLHHHGNFASKCLELDNLHKYYQFGIRGINNALHKDKNPKLEIYWADQVKSILKTDQKIELPQDEYYYITFDIDVLDPSVAPGTATPIPGGFNLDEILSLFKKLELEDKNIIGIDFVEVNKEKDPESLTTALSVQLVLNLLNFINIR